MRLPALASYSLLAAAATAYDGTVVQPDWATTTRTQKTETTLQVVVNALLQRSSPVHDAIFASLANLSASSVRFVPWLPYPGLGVGELERASRGVG